MENLLIVLSIVFGGIGIGTIVWTLIYLYSPSINGKQWIEDSMTEKYGADWLEQCLEGLRNPEVRKTIADELKL